MTCEKTPFSYIWVTTRKERRDPCYNQSGEEDNAKENFYSFCVQKEKKNEEPEL